jgi:DNA replication and repair protein RecF
VLVTAIEAKPLRSLDGVRVELAPGIVSIIGPNGAGKTNLIEALYFALTGRSFRTSDRRDMIPFGGSLARAEATIRDEDGVEHTLLAAISRSEGRRHLLDGNPADPATLARSRPPVAVFSPDRLTLVKGPPAERRAHLDGVVAARWPARAELR